MENEYWINRILGWERLDEDWDSYGGAKPSTETIHHALCLVNYLFTQPGQIDNVALGPNDDFSITFQPPGFTYRLYIWVETLGISIYGWKETFQELEDPAAIEIAEQIRRFFLGIDRY